MLLGLTKSVITANLAKMDPAKKDVFHKALASQGKCLHKLVQMLTYLGPSIKSLSDLSNHDSEESVLKEHLNYQFLLICPTCY